MPEPADASVTGRELAARRPGRNPHTGEQQGELVRHPKGSNGGVHRGPDLGLRRHLIRGVLLEAMARKGETLKSLRDKNEKRKKKLMPHAMTEYIAESLQHLTQAAAGVYTPTRAELRTWGLLLDFTRSVHDILQPTKDEEKRDQPVIVPVFKLAPAKAPTPEVTGAPEPAPEARQPLTVDGQVYE